MVFRKRPRWLALLCGSAFLWLAVGPIALVGAAVQTVTVDSTAGPWDWKGSVNTSLTYGAGDYTAPVVVSSGFDFSAGNIFTVTYLSGLTNPFGGTPLFDANGDLGYDASNNPGSTGMYFPSLYIPSASYPVYLAALVGAFTDSTGAVIGTPFVLGDGPTNVTAPTGATQLQLGINDDYFSDNTGSLLVQVSGPSAVSTIPEPSTLVVWSLLGSLAVGLGWWRKRKAT